MYGDQFGEFVCGYWGLKGSQNLPTAGSLTWDYLFSKYR